MGNTGTIMIFRMAYFKTFYKILITMFVVIDFYFIVITY